jgi:Ni,Fe-hydrogenase III large subunit
MTPEALGFAHVAIDHVPHRDGYIRLDVDLDTWKALARGCAAGLQDFGAIWRDGARVRMMLYDAPANLRLIISTVLENKTYPSVSQFHAPASRPERALRELQGVIPENLPDLRNWLDHGAWPRPSGQGKNNSHQPYTFLPVEGEGLHQIPVGPVHAGIIEPGHFRFTANGEAVVRLQQRLGYVHKGIEALCTGADISKAANIAARISGDSTVATSFAFALAVEAALDVEAPFRAQLLRGIMAELERISHHINDVGAICNDASVVALQARCALLREDILQTAAACFGHRMMMDCIVPGGVSRDMAAGSVTLIENLLQRVSAGFEAVVKVYDDLPSLQDRTVTTGVVSPDLVRRFAAGGHVGRASGRNFDTRAAFPYAPYGSDDFTPCVRKEGDVNARVWVRIMEVRASINIIRSLLARLQDGPVSSSVPTGRAGEGAAMVEAFRGDFFIQLRIDDHGRVASFHARDASWFQWPLLEAAIEGNIVADFPLCNKSFNCSYSGHDM